MGGKSAGSLGVGQWQPPNTRSQSTFSPDQRPPVDLVACPLLLPPLGYLGGGPPGAPPFPGVPGLGNLAANLPPMHLLTQAPQDATPEFDDDCDDVPFPVAPDDDD